MGFLDRLLGNDHERAAARPDRESASDTAARKRRQSYRKNVTKTARQGQAWEDADRQQDRKGPWYRAR
jgi:hypothetical protein